MPLKDNEYHNFKFPIISNKNMSDTQTREAGTI